MNSLLFKTLASAPPLYLISKLTQKETTKIDAEKEHDNPHGHPGFGAKDNQKERA